MSTHSDRAGERQSLVRELTALCREHPFAVAWVARRASRFQREGQACAEAYRRALAEVGR